MSTGGQSRTSEPPEPDETVYHIPRTISTRPDMVPVLMLLRDNAYYVEHCLPILIRHVVTALRRRQLWPYFYMYENNSIDTTPKLLQELHMDMANMTFLSERVTTTRNTTRPERLGRCRNTLLGMAWSDVRQSRIAIMMDTNVAFTSKTIEVLIQTMDSDPSIGLATALTEDVSAPGHYYDTYAYTCLRDKHRPVVHRRYCPIIECTSCHTRHCIKLFSKMQPTPHVVASAFGGLAVFDSRVLELVQWSSRNNVCEHVAMCQRIRALGRTIVVVPQAKALWTNQLTESARGIFRNICVL